jgi:general L-amino acid transport system substrate-binding protein
LKGFAMKRVSLVFTLALAAGFSSQAATAQTLKTVKDRGQLSCGVSQGLPGFSSPDDKGNWTGLDVDFCRAIAAAVFNDPTKIKFVPLSARTDLRRCSPGETRRVVAQHHLDRVARHLARRQLHRRHLL